MVVVVVVVDVVVVVVVVVAGTKAEDNWKQKLIISVCGVMEYIYHIIRNIKIPTYLKIKTYIKFVGKRH